MVITVVGAKGIVGRTLVEHFIFLDHTVHEVDLENQQEMGALAKKSDIVFVVTRPIRKVGSIIRELAKTMRSGSLLVHGTSVEFPRGQSFPSAALFKKEITLAHLHFHFRPSIPLRETLRGHHLTLKVEGQAQNTWHNWLCETFSPHMVFIHPMVNTRHDETTAISQLAHMITGVLLSSLWRQTPQVELDWARTISGPPARMLTRSVVRTAGGAGVAAEILECHPRTHQVINRFRKALDKLERAVERKDVSTIETILKRAIGTFESGQLKTMELMTERLIRLEADLESANVVLNFPKHKNQTGLLVRVLQEFDKRDIAKSTTIAQTNPDGSCTFIIGVIGWNPKIDDAVNAIQSWS